MASALMPNPVGDPSYLKATFSSSRYAALRALSVICRADGVTLQGQVPTYYVRQLAIAHAKKHYPTVAITDEIVVATEKG